MKKQTLKKLALATGVAAAIAAPASQASIIDHPFFRVLGVVIVWGTDTATGTKAIASDFVLMTGASDSAGTDLIAAHGRAVITGSLSGAPASEAAGSLMSITDPASGGVLTDNGTSGYLDAADVMTAFELDGTTDVDLSTSQVEHSFYVASNTAFDIHAVVSNFNTTDDFDAGATKLALTDIGYALAVNAAGATDGAITWGANAQDPTGSGSGSTTVSATTLDDFSSIAKVFDGGQKTAASTGTIASQSVRFDATYTLGAATGYDLSMGSGVVEADVTYTIFVP